jgi:hypothetical protein
MDRPLHGLKTDVVVEVDPFTLSSMDQPASVFHTASAASTTCDPPPSINQQA